MGSTASAGSGGYPEVISFGGASELRVHGREVDGEEGLALSSMAVCELPYSCLPAPPSSLSPPSARLRPILCPRPGEIIARPWISIEIDSLAWGKVRMMMEIPLLQRPRYHSVGVLNSLDVEWWLSNTVVGLGMRTVLSSVACWILEAPCCGGTPGGNETEKGDGVTDTTMA